MSTGNISSLFFVLAVGQIELTWIKYGPIGFIILKKMLKTIYWLYNDTFVLRDFNEK